MRILRPFCLNLFPVLLKNPGFLGLSLIHISNLELLAELGYAVEEKITPNDLVIAITGSTDQQLESAVQLVFDLLDHKAGGEEAESYRALDEIDLKDDPYDLVQISLPGEYAAEEAKKALEKGLDVFIFSDNVPILSLIHIFGSYDH